MGRKITKLPKSEVEIESELPEDIFESYFELALKKAGHNLEIPGFRKGKAPEAVLISRIGEMRILEEMAELALSDAYPKIIAEEKIEALGRPAISITKLARKNPLGFKVRTAVLPEIKLPDYKKLAQKVKEELKKGDQPIEVSDEELSNTIDDIRKSRAPKDGEPPAFDDTFAQSLGPFKDVNDFKIKLKENLKLEKENQAREKTRLKIIEEIIKESKIDLPEILAEIELDKMMHRMESDIAQMGLKFEDYLKHLKKTAEDLKKEIRPDAEKKAKLGLILNEIAKAEKFAADKEQVDREVAHILEHYKDADPERARIHAENVLSNEKVFVFLENQ